MTTRPPAEIGMSLDEVDTPALMIDLDTRAIRSPLRTTDSGRRTGGCRISRGQLYALLQNPIYVGKIRHKDRVYDGTHPPIIDAALWDAVQSRLADNRAERRQPTNRKDPSLLAGLLFTSEGERLRPTHAIKGSRRYCYYISDRLMRGAAQDGAVGLRIAAAEIESAVITSLGNLLADPGRLSDLMFASGSAAASLADQLRNAGALAVRVRNPAEPQRIALLHKILHRVVVDRRTMRIEIRRKALGVHLPRDGIAEAEDDEKVGEHLVLDLPLLLRKRGVETRLVLGGQDAPATDPEPVLLRSIIQGRLWLRRFVTGEASTLASIAATDGVDTGLVSRAVALAHLAPEIVAAIVAGRQPEDLTAERLLRLSDLPISWSAQCQLLGIARPA